MLARYPQLQSFDITDQRVFQQRRKLLSSMSLGMLAAAAPPLTFATQQAASPQQCPTITLATIKDEITTKKAATSYNNYYEFSTDKEAVRFLAKALTLSPWTVSISGEVEKPLRLDIDDIRKYCQEERIYRFRCVEGWSMVVPWLGVSLSHIIKQAMPLSSAKFVRFSSITNPKEMIGQRRPVFDWPYQEALRMDEAMHPLTLLATGMYGENMPAQNGAPLRLVVPWKYGFKSIKAVAHIELMEQQPITTWQKAAPNEYGFYANVNPRVAHPRWSQRREVPLGQTKKKSTLMFNGYADQVSHLYSNMDLSQHF
jgi:sulfoxide reductase catalytic subunit YedY